MQESKNMQFYQIKVAKQTNSRNEWAAVQKRWNKFKRTLYMTWIAIHSVLQGLSFVVWA
jgi:hypothetical protein